MVIIVIRRHIVLFEQGEGNILTHSVVFVGPLTHSVVFVGPLTHSVVFVGPLFGYVMDSSFKMHRSS
jgi:hypothetical protein